MMTSTCGVRCECLCVPVCFCVCVCVCVCVSLVVAQALVKNVSVCVCVHVTCIHIYVHAYTYIVLSDHTHTHTRITPQDHMKILTQQNRILIPVTEPPPTPPEGCNIVHQIVAKKGDIVLFHPWTIHSGTTNMGHVPRLMGNGMVVVKREAFERVGCMILGEDRHLEARKRPRNM